MTDRRPRRIVLAPVGSRGDVQPMLALALGLRARGHHVLLAAPANFAEWSRAHDIPFAVAGSDMEADLRRHGDRVQALGHQMRILRREVVPQQFAALPGICDGADLIVGAGLQTAGPSVAAARGVPYVFVAYAPVVLRSAQHAPPLVRRQGMPAAMNRVAWRVFHRLLRLVLTDPISRGRRSLGLAPVHDVAAYLTEYPIVLASDLALTGEVPDLAPNVHRVPAIRLSDGTGLPDDVRAFLDAGPAPVLVGFGSMVTHRMRELVGLFSRAAQLAGVRLLIQAGWTGLTARDVVLPPDVRLIGQVSHQALVPRVRAVVHHGGAGTTASVARGGVPQLVVPHLLDQFYWADRVRALGLGPVPVPVWRVRRAAPLAERLARLVGTDDYARRAGALAQRIGESNGADETVDLLERR